MTKETAITTTVGLDLGGTKLLAVRLEGDAVVAEQRFSNPGVAEQLAPAVIEGIEAVMTAEVAGIGVGIAGLVSWPDGVFRWGPHVAGTEVPLRSELVSAYGLPTVVDNDANCGAWGEYRIGAGVGSNSMLLVTLGTGIGGAIVIEGHLYRGASFAGEWGHTMFERHGAQCACGRRGCWETVASGPALVRLAGELISRTPDGTLARRLGTSAFTGEAVTEAAAAGDQSARGLVAQVGADLGRGIANLVASFDPELIVIGGGLGSVGEVLLDPARRVLADSIHGGSHRKPPPIVVAQLGAAAGAIGAAVMARDLAAGELPGMEPPGSSP